MIPLFAILEVRGHRSLRLWLPLFLIWLLLLPVVLVLLPFVLLALLFARIDGWRAFTAFWNLLSGTRGLHIEVSTPGKLVFLHVY
jgi:hypothetical protein